MHKVYYLFAAVWTVVIFSACENNKEKITSSYNTTKSQTIEVTEGAVKISKKVLPNKENSGQFYYSYNKEKKKSEYERQTEKVRTKLDAYRAIHSPYERVQITLMVQQLSPDYHLLCSACHDDYANGVVGPALLDKNATYIFNQIMAFKTGEKRNPLMKELVNRIAPDRLKAIAKEIERFNRQILKMRSNEQ